MKTDTSTIFDVYDASLGDSTENLTDAAPQFPYFNFMFSAYGFDANDGDLKLQGSLNNTSWFDIANVTATQSANFTTQSFVSATEMIVTGNAVDELTANPRFFIDGSTSNDGRHESTSTDLQTLVTYSNLVGVFQVSEGVTFVGSGATGIIVVDDGAGEMRVTDVVGVPAATDTLLGVISAATADVDTVATVTSIITSGLVVEAALGEIWEGSQFILLIATANTIWNYYRMVFTANAVTVGFLDGTSFAKNYEA